MGIKKMQLMLEEEQKKKEEEVKIETPTKIEIQKE